MSEIYPHGDDDSSEKHKSLSQRLNEQLKPLQAEQIEYDEDKLIEINKTISSFKEQGNEKFYQEKYYEASEYYQKAIDLCSPNQHNHIKARLHSNMAACLENINERSKAIEHCSKAVELDSAFVRPLLRRAILFEKTDRLQDAFDDFKNILKLEPTCIKAQRAIIELPPLIDQRNQEMKEEVMDKLKQLGNMVLKPFGLSTDNFKMIQDPNTGSYSVSMQK